MSPGSRLWPLNKHFLGVSLKFPEDAESLIQNRSSGRVPKSSSNTQPLDTERKLNVPEAFRRRPE